MKQRMSEWEDHMDYSGQTLESNLQAEFSQEQSTKPTLLPEQRLFRHITRLTLLLGIIFGCWLVLNGEILYSTQLHLSAFTIVHQLGPLMVISFGAVCIVLRNLQRLRSQHPTFQPGRFDLLGNYPWPFSSLSFGLLLIWIGSSQLVWEWLRLDADIGFIVFLIGALVGISGLLAEPLIPFLKDRRMTQR